MEGGSHKNEAKERDDERERNGEGDGPFTGRMSCKWPRVPLLFPEELQE